MCGIVGICQNNQPITETLLLAMRDTLIHRGPDDSGIWLNPQKTVGLAHRRLAIIDLSVAGHQPMSDEQKEVWITYNGEIYNFSDIKTELKIKGYNFKSSTDTEVIIYAYKEWGIDCLNKFNGMFALGIFDQRTNKILLARDRVGKKPLYYSNYKNKFAFSSELKALLVDPDFPMGIDYQSLNWYLTFGYIPFELSIYKQAKKLPPASYLLYDIANGNLVIRQYWHLPDQQNQEYQEVELLEELKCLLKSAVRLRLLSDVPLGAFLSGGLDSSLIVAMMAEVSQRPIKTFSIGFTEKKCNELPYARLVASHFGTDHTELMVKPEPLEILPELVKHLDEPLADSSIIPTYYVSKMTRNYVTVGLSGDGGDELFAGYSSYLGTLLNHRLANNVPWLLRQLVSRGAGLIPRKYAAKKHLLRLGYEPQEAFLDRLSFRYFNKVNRRKVLSQYVLNLLGADYDQPERSISHILNNQSRDFLNKLEATDFLSYLPEDLLTKVDRTSMKVSLEVRCPFLDYRIVEFAFSKVPAKYKIRGFERKYLLHKLARQILPKDFDLKRKQGFNMPMANWFKGKCLRWSRDLLMSDKSGFFNDIYISNLLKDHQNGFDQSERLWTLLIWQLWQNNLNIKV